MADSTFTIFYSWQSDLPNSTTRGLIESSIEAAVRSLRDTVSVYADRDTQGVTGSPDIVQTIFSKIDECDVFVADVTSVATYHPLDKDGNETDRLKATPNANVMIELGYATQVVGWDNIICMMNDDYNHDGEIPFDIEHHRLTHFSLLGKEKAEVRKQLRDIIADTVMNVMENGKRVQPQFSNISIGSWNGETKAVSKSLIPYNVYASGPAKSIKEVMLDTVRMLLENIQTAKVRNVDELPPVEEIAPEKESVQSEKIITKDGIELTPLPSKVLLDFNKWSPVVIQEKEKIDTIAEIKAYLGIEAGMEIFDFGGLRRKISMIPGFGSEYDGTDEEKQKYDDYVEMVATIARIQMLETYFKTFDGVILLPLAAQNESSISDSDITISIQIENSTAEAIYPTAELICDDLKGVAGYVYEEGLVEMTLAQNDTVDMLLKCVFYSAIESDVIRDNPAACINPRGGKSKKEKVALTDKQIATLLDTIKALPPHLFVMLGLYAGLRREEILGLQWDCVHIDEEIPYISVRRAWRSVKNRPEVTTLLKTPAARRDIPIPQLLVDCLKAEKEKSSSDYVISDSNGEPLSYSQFSRVWHYITVRTVKERKIYRYINGEKIHHTISPKLGERCRTDKSIYYTLDFDVTPHLLRHTYITNLIHEGVDPKTVQYLAGHENSKVTMDIYAKVKYNKPWELATVVNEAFQPTNDIEENPAS